MVEREGETKYRKKDDPFCQWKTADRQCRMMGTLSKGFNTDQSKADFFCSWHWTALENPTFAQDFNEFLKWRDLILKEYPDYPPEIKPIAGYRTPWHRHEDELWAKVNGNDLEIMA